jgi:23S rRNA U2552 (ribose-2'-O)-methylase RlmE/FtsJ
MYEARDQFQVTIDKLGNIFCRPGTVIDLGASPTEFFQIESDLEDDNIIGGEVQRMPDQYQLRFKRGSGQSVATAASVTGTFAPTGYFRRIGKFTWISDYGHKIQFDPATGDADILDFDEAETVIATFSDPSATLAPVGTFTSTIAGEDTYNGGSAFTLASTYEGRAEDVVANALVEGTIAPFGTFNQIIDGQYSFSNGSWEADADNNWTITIDSAGDAELSDGTNLVATRPEGELLDPTGTYLSTTYGSETYNGNAGFYFTVGIELVPPLAGYVHAKLTLSSGRVTSADGIFFAASMPANSSTEQYVPIAYSDGAGKVVQIQQGPIYWK